MSNKKKHRGALVRFIIHSAGIQSHDFKIILGGVGTVGTFRRKLSFKLAFVTLKMKTRESDFGPDCCRFVMFVMYSRVHLLIKCSNLVFIFIQIASFSFTTAPDFPSLLQ